MTALPSSCDVNDVLGFKIERLQRTRRRCLTGWLVIRNYSIVSSWAELNSTLRFAGLRIAYFPRNSRFSDKLLRNSISD